MSALLCCVAFTYLADGFAENVGFAIKLIKPVVDVMLKMRPCFRIFDVSALARLSNGFRIFTHVYGTSIQLDTNFFVEKTKVHLRTCVGRYTNDIEFGSFLPQGLLNCPSPLLVRRCSKGHILE